MNPTVQFSLRIAEPTSAAPMSRARKQFNSLTKKLAATRLRLAAWHETLTIIEREATQELAPLIDVYADQQRAFVLLLDAMSQRKLGKRERAKLIELISTMAYALLRDRDDAELKAIFHHHSGTDFDAEADADGALFKDVVKNMLGDDIDIDDADIDWRSPEAALDELSRRAKAERDSAPHRGDEHDGAPGAPRRKSASMIAREQRQAAEAGQLKQTVRDIFRKLVSELHPDREPDSAERTRKTALMQRVNAAYAANDLLGLLELQLEIEQIDQASLDRLSDERITQFNKVLNGQLRDIERETATIEHMATMEMGSARRAMTPAAVLRNLRADIAELRTNSAALAAELEELQDFTTFKAWLKMYRPPEPYDDDDAFWC